MNSTFRSLRHRNYRIFVAGQVVSLTGTWMQMVAMGWLALQLTDDSGAAIGLLLGLQTLPMVLFGMVGGLVADRVPRRPLLAATMAFEAALAVCLGVLDLAGVVAFWHLLLIAFLTGLAGAIATPAHQAFVSELVQPEDVPNAIGLTSAIFNVARLLGPVGAGVMVNIVGTGPVFIVNAVSFAAVIVGLAAIRTEELHPVPLVARGPGQLRAVLPYVRSNPDLLLPMVLMGLVGTIGFNFSVTLPLIAKGTFDRGAASYGVLSVAVAAGSLIGALVGARRTRRPRVRMLISMTMIFGCIEALAGAMPTYTTMLIMLVPTGTAVVLLATACNAAVQLGSKPEMRGRVLALYFLVFIGGTPLGAPLIGVLAEAFGPRSGLVAGGGLCAVASLVVFLVTARRRGVRVRPHFSRRPHLHVLTGRGC